MRARIPEISLKVGPSVTPWYLQRVLTFCGICESYRRETTIDTLPDDVLFEIFDLCRTHFYFNLFCIVWKWHKLVHVCRRWRQLIFESPRRLNIQILCTHKTPVVENLRIWPAFPIVIDFKYSERRVGPEGEDNIIAALGYLDRVSWVRLKVSRRELENVVTVMQVPFPVLTRLEIYSDDRYAPVLPTGFLGGSAPRLQAIVLRGIPFPTLPVLLLSSRNLISLNLYKIPPAGYISPEAMVVSLAALTRLQDLIITFQLVIPYLYQIRPPPVTRTILPALTAFTFQGACAYLENLVARIDSPQLDCIHINYPNQGFDLPAAQQLAKFLDRSMGPKLTLLRHARVNFDYYFTFYMYRHPFPLAISHILCTGIERHLSNIAQSFRQFSTALSNVVHLRFEVQPGKSRQFVEGTDDVEWLLLLRQFSTVRSLYVSQDLTWPVSLALEDIDVEMVAEVLPSLELICLAGQPASSVRRFVAARQFSGRPVIVVDTKTEFSKRLASSFSE